MGKLNFRGYLISQFYPTREIRENLMHAKNMFYRCNLGRVRTFLYLVIACMCILFVNCFGLCVFLCFYYSVFCIVLYDFMYLYCAASA